MATIAKLKNVNTREVREKVWRYLLDCSGEHDLADDAAIAQHIADRFYKEYCFENNMGKMPNHHERLSSWLQCLALPVDHNYHKIMDKYADIHACEVSDFSDKQWEKLCEDWWKFLGLKLLQMFKHYKVNEDWR